MEQMAGILPVKIKQEPPDYNETMPQIVDTPPLPVENIIHEAVPTMLLQVQYIQQEQNVFKVLVPQSTSCIEFNEQKEPSEKGNGNKSNTESMQSSQQSSFDNLQGMKPVICQIQEAKTFEEQWQEETPVLTTFSDLSSQFKTVKSVVKLPVGLDSAMGATKKQTTSTHSSQTKANSRSVLLPPENRNKNREPPVLTAVEPIKENLSNEVALAKSPPPVLVPMKPIPYPTALLKAAPRPSTPVQRPIPSLTPPIVPQVMEDVKPNVEELARLLSLKSAIKTDDKMELDEDIKHKPRNRNYSSSSSSTDSDDTDSSSSSPSSSSSSSSESEKDDVKDQPPRLSPMEVDKTKQIPKDKPSKEVILPKEESLEPTESLELPLKSPTPSPTTLKSLTPTPEPSLEIVETKPTIESTELEIIPEPQPQLKRDIHHNLRPKKPNPILQSLKKIKRADKPPVIPRVPRVKTIKAPPKLKPVIEKKKQTAAPKTPPTLLFKPRPKLLPTATNQCARILLNAKSQAITLSQQRSRNKGFLQVKKPTSAWNEEILPPNEEEDSSSSSSSSSSDEDSYLDHVMNINTPQLNMNFDPRKKIIFNEPIKPTNKRPPTKRTPPIRDINYTIRHDDPPQICSSPDLFQQNLGGDWLDFDRSMDENSLNSVHSSNLSNATRIPQLIPKLDAETLTKLLEKRRPIEKLNKQKLAVSNKTNTNEPKKHGPPPHGKPTSKTYEIPDKPPPLEIPMCEEIVITAPIIDYRPEKSDEFLYKGKYDNEFRVKKKRRKHHLDKRIDSLAKSSDTSEDTSNDSSLFEKNTLRQTHLKTVMSSPTLSTAQSLLELAESLAQSSSSEVPEPIENIKPVEPKKPIALKRPVIYAPLTKPDSIETSKQTTPTSVLASKQTPTEPEPTKKTDTTPKYNFPTTETINKDGKREVTIIIPQNCFSMKDGQIIVPKDFLMPYLSKGGQVRLMFQSPNGENAENVDKSQVMSIDATTKSTLTGATATFQTLLQKNTIPIAIPTSTGPTALISKPSTSNQTTTKSPVVQITQPNTKIATKVGPQKNVLLPQQSKPGTRIVIKPSNSASPKPILQVLQEALKTQGKAGQQFKILIPKTQSSGNAKLSKASQLLTSMASNIAKVHKTQPNPVLSPLIQTTAPVDTTALKSEPIFKPIFAKLPFGDTRQKILTKSIVAPTIVKVPPPITTTTPKVNVKPSILKTTSPVVTKLSIGATSVVLSQPKVPGSKQPTIMDAASLEKFSKNPTGTITINNPKNIAGPLIMTSKGQRFLLIPQSATGTVKTNAVPKHNILQTSKIEVKNAPTTKDAKAIAPPKPTELKSVLRPTKQAPKKNIIYVQKPQQKQVAIQKPVTQQTPEIICSSQTPSPQLPQTVISQEIVQEPVVAQQIIEDEMGRQYLYEGGGEGLFYNPITQQMMFDPSNYKLIKDPTEENTVQDTEVQDVVRGMVQDSMVQQHQTLLQDTMVHQTVLPESTLHETREQNLTLQESISQEIMLQQSFSHGSMVQQDSINQENENIVQDSMAQDAFVQDSMDPEDMVQDSSRQEDMIQESARQEDMIQESARQEDMIQESARQEDMIQESARQEDMIQESARQEDMIQESARQEPMVHNRKSQLGGLAALQAAVDQQLMQEELAEQLLQMNNFGNEQPIDQQIVHETMDHLQTMVDQPLFQENIYLGDLSNQVLEQNFQEVLQQNINQEESNLDQQGTCQEPVVQEETNEKHQMILQHHVYQGQATIEANQELSLQQVTQDILIEQGPPEHLFDDQQLNEKRDQSNQEQTLEDQPNHDASVKEYLNQEQFLQDQSDLCNEKLLVHEQSNHEILVQETSNHEILVQETSNHEILVQEPSNHEMLVQEPSTHEILVQDPSTHEILVQDPSTHEILVQDPSTHEILVQDPSTHEILVQEPSTHEILVQEPSTHEILVQEPSTHEILVQEPSTHEILVQEPSTHEILVQEPSTHEILVQEPSNHEKLVQDNSDQESFVKEKSDKELMQEIDQDQLPIEQFDQDQLPIEQFEQDQLPIEQVDQDELFYEEIGQDPLTDDRLDHDHSQHEEVEKVQSHHEEVEKVQSQNGKANQQLIKVNLELAQQVNQEQFLQEQSNQEYFHQQPIEEQFLDKQIDQEQLEQQSNREQFLQETVNQKLLEEQSKRETSLKPINQERLEQHSNKETFLQESVNQKLLQQQTNQEQFLQEEVNQELLQRQVNQVQNQQSNNEQIVQQQTNQSNQELLQQQVQEGLANQFIIDNSNEPLFQDPKNQELLQNQLLQHFGNQPRATDESVPQPVTDGIIQQDYFEEQIIDEAGQQIFYLEDGSQITPEMYKQIVGDQFIFQESMDDVNTTQLNQNLVVDELNQPLYEKVIPESIDNSIIYSQVPQVELRSQMVQNSAVENETRELSSHPANQFEINPEMAEIYKELQIPIETLGDTPNSDHLSQQSEEQMNFINSLISDGGQLLDPAMNGQFNTLQFNEFEVSSTESSGSGNCKRKSNDNSDQPLIKKSLLDSSIVSDLVNSAVVVNTGILLTTELRGKVTNNQVLASCNEGFPLITTKSNGTYERKITSVNGSNDVTSENLNQGTNDFFVAESVPNALENQTGSTVS